MTETPTATTSIRPDRLRLAILFMVGLVGVLGSVVLFKTQRQREHAVFEATFQQTAVERIRLIQHELDNSLTLITALGAFVENSRPLTRDAFGNFAQQLIFRHEALQALEWVPRVRDDERNDHEKQTWREGFRTYRITEANSDGELVVAGQRPEYHVVHFVEPFLRNREAFGYDLGSEPIRFEGLLRARDHGELAATAPVRLVQAYEDHAGLLVYHPIYDAGGVPGDERERRASLEGCAVLVLDVDTLVEHALAGKTQRDIESTIHDETDPDRPQQLIGPDQLDVETPRVAESISVGGRDWVIRCAPTADSLAASLSWVPFGLLVGGLVTTSLLLYYLTRLMGIQTQVQVEMAKIEAQLVRQARLAAIGQLAGSVAHDLRNPLGGIRNAAYYLRHKKGGPSSETWKRYLNMIDEETEKADEIISALLDHGRARAPVKETVPLAHLIESALDQINPRNVRCDCRFDTKHIAVYGDSAQLKRAFVNLIINASQAMEGQGAIRIEWQAVNGFDEITVRDQGPGVPPEIQHQIFEPLYTTKAKGTGLGLALCRQVVEGHGGTIELLDHADTTGSAFLLRLPRRGPNSLP